MTIKQTFLVNPKTPSLLLSYSAKGYEAVGYLLPCGEQWQFELYSRKKYLTVFAGDIELGKRMIEKKIQSTVAG